MIYLYYSRMRGFVNARRRKGPLQKVADLSFLGLERREVEKSFYGGKGAAHGFRNLSAIKITGDFERPMTQMKTKCVEIMNGGSKGSP